MRLRESSGSVHLGYVTDSLWNWRLFGHLKRRQKDRSLSKENGLKVVQDSAILEDKGKPINILHEPFESELYHIQIDVLRI